MEKIKGIIKDMISNIWFIISLICTIGVIIISILEPVYIIGVCMGLCIGVVICDMIIIIFKNIHNNIDSKDDLELKLEKVMHYATGGFLSNINLSYETIEDAITDYVKECMEEAAKKTKKDYGIE